DGAGQLADSHRWNAAVLVDDAHLQVLDVAAKSVAQHDELHDWKDHRYDDERWTAAEPPQLALDDGPGSIHGIPSLDGLKGRVNPAPPTTISHCRRIMNPRSSGDASCSASRSARPV